MSDTLMQKIYNQYKNWIPYTILQDLGIIP